jgi:hypothetical protein
VDDEGVVQEELEFASEDEGVSFTIAAETAALTEDSEPLGEIQIAEFSGNMPDLPERTSEIGKVYDLSPDGATFDPPATIKVMYDPELIPEDVAADELELAYYDRVSDEWVPLESIVHTGAHKVEAQLAHFTAFAILGTSPAPELNTWAVAGPILFIVFIGLFTLVLARYY